MLSVITEAKSVIKQTTGHQGLGGKWYIHRNIPILVYSINRSHDFLCFMLKWSNCYLQLFMTYFKITRRPWFFPVHGMINEGMEMQNPPTFYSSYVHALTYCTKCHKNGQICNNLKHVKLSVYPQIMGPST